MPYQPAPVPSLSRAEFRRTVRAAVTDTVIAQANSARNHTPARPTNRRPMWNAPTRVYLFNGRAGSLTPAQEHRSRHSERV
ncbi:hypothetical protein [Plantactinospora sp. KLBMP9567]|uniref:hypothetical protein n=1 Tax=Plantactinospora sp. KLBMP9567 TaxID=3085900 RepID=UPI002982A91D|nr:hypothetical protein [Plantactinospora sp. KLBMP9567]MDW5327732.1 hypothetical protein [Plantactinospora sp. KLBMP9567]